MGRKVVGRMPRARGSQREWKRYSQIAFQVGILTALLVALAWLVLRSPSISDALRGETCAELYQKVRTASETAAVDHRHVNQTRQRGVGSLNCGALRVLGRVPQN